MEAVFALVLGLFALLYVAAVMAMLGIEINVVLARRLYPRALLTPFTDQSTSPTRTVASTPSTRKPSGTRDSSTSPSRSPTSRGRTPAMKATRRRRPSRKAGAGRTVTPYGSRHGEHTLAGPCAGRSPPGPGPRPSSGSWGSVERGSSSSRTSTRGRPCCGSRRTRARVVQGQRRDRCATRRRGRRRCCSARVPDAVPPLLAVDPVTGWMLMADAGEQLRTVVPRERSLARWLDVLELYAGIQLDLGRRRGRAARAGVPDLRLGDPAGEVRPADGRDRRRASGSARPSGRVAELADELAAYGLPELLQHDDLHDGQVFVREGSTWSWTGATPASPTRSSRSR